MKKQEGITLIALVITIIVLLILAGVTIAMLTGDNGLLTRASEAKTENELAAYKDRVNLAIQSVYADILSPNSATTTITESGIATQYNTDNGEGTAIAGTAGSNQLTVKETSSSTVSYTVTLNSTNTKIVSITKN